MDLSKLPRMSKTDTPHNDPGPEDPAPKGADGFPVGPAAPQKDPAAPVPFVTASAWCPNCGAPLAPASKFCNSCGARLSFGATGGGEGAAGDVPPGAGIEGWISIGVGLFLFFMAPMGIQYWSATLTGREFKPYDPPPGITEKVAFQRFQDMNTGAITDVYYRDTTAFWSDSAVTAFALVLILEGIVLAFVRRKAMVAITFALTLAATLFNLAWVATSMAKGYGFPPISFLAVLFGGYMCFHQWSMLQWMRATSTPRRGMAG
jgi:hypothetical protein